MKVICVKGNKPRNGFAAVLTKGKIYQLHIRFVNNSVVYWFDDDEGIDKVLEHD